MIRNPLSARLDPASPLRDQVRRAATLGLKGVVIEAIGDIHPDRLGESGRREVSQLLRSVELKLVAIVLPTRSGFDHADELDARLRRADRAFALAYDLGTAIVLARVGPVPEEGERRAIFSEALAELARLADRRGIRLGLESAAEPGATLRTFLDSKGTPVLAASVDPGILLAAGIDPVIAVRELGPWVAHAYATDGGSQARPSVAAHPRGHGFAPGVLDWEEYLGALEEVNYHGFLTAWPEAGKIDVQIPALIERLKRF